MTELFAYPGTKIFALTPQGQTVVYRELQKNLLQFTREYGDILSHPGVLFKALILLVNNYTQLYAHMRRCPNNTLN